MAERELTSDDNALSEPIACSLRPTDLATQADRWSQLAARAMIERAETARGLRICFRAGAGVEGELRQLVAVENECCPWAAWSVEASAERVVLDVRSAAAGVTTLHGMFTGLRSAAGPRRD